VFETNANFQADKSVNLKLSGGDNSVTIGDGGGPVSIFGGLSIDTRNGNDTVILDQVSLAGAVKIKTGVGADNLSIEDGSEFLSTFTADMGSGDDSISIAQNTGGTDPVSFGGITKITAGTGNDSLVLGLAIGSGGDAGTNVVFGNAAASILDGGLGLDDFDSADAQSNLTPTGWNP
jgi:hypothetical protein